MPDWLRLQRLRFMSRIRRVIYKIFGFPPKAILIVQDENGSLDALYWDTTRSARANCEYWNTEYPYGRKIALYDIFYSHDWTKNLDQHLADYISKEKTHGA